MNIVSQELLEPARVSPDAGPRIASWAIFLEIDFRRTGNSVAFRTDGWSGQEADAVWATGPSSGMIFPAVTAADDLLVEIDIDACVTPPHIFGQVLRVRANGQLLGGTRIIGKSTVRFRINRAILRDGEPLELRFEHPCFVRVDLAGGAKDDRTLSVRFRKLTIFSEPLAQFRGADAAGSTYGEVRDIVLDAERPAASGGADHHIYDFAPGNANAALLREGWYSDASGKVWASADACRIELPCPSAAVPYRLRLAIAPLLVRDLLPNQSITVLLQDCVVGQFILSSDTVLSVPLPAELIRDFAALKLVFLAPLGVAMAEFQGGGAERLSFLLERIDIEPVPEHLSAVGDLRGDDTDRLVPIAASGRFLDVSLDAFPAAIEAGLGVPLETILRQFESLGDNCAFGLAQRKGGVEVLGLLRFANTPLKTLIVGLEDEFAAAADPAEMAIRPHTEGDPREYTLWLDRYGIRWHTQIHVPDADAETVFEQQSVKVGYLRRKFVEGIRAGRKIYALARVDVYKLNRVMPAWGAPWKYQLLRENLRLAEVLPVFLQLNRHARNTLLYIVVGGHGGKASGTVEMLAPGLLLGHIDNPVISDDIAIRDHLEWTRVIVNAWIIENSANAAFRGRDDLSGRWVERDLLGAESLPLVPIEAVPETSQPSSAPTSVVDETPTIETQSNAAEPESLRDLLLKFESIGENCEFGLAQRRCDAEPLGLFRFTSAPYDKLLPALEADLQGLGDPDKIEVQVSGNGKEYMVLDKRFGFLSHAWVLVGEMDIEEVYRREIRRLPFLVRKLRNDLKLGEKIFVYHGMDPLTLSEAQRLSAALRRYGADNTLLWVELADADHEPGTVERIEPGLLKGYIDRFAPGSNAHDFSVDSWIVICRAALSLWAG